MAGGQDVRQLLLQVDASVALAQRNLNSLRQTVDRETQAMDASLQKPEDALARLGNVFRSFDQVMVASSNQQRAFGLSLDQATAKELQAANAISALARAISGLNTPVQIATREQLAAAAAIGNFAAASTRLDGVMRRGAVSHQQYRAGAQQLGFQIGDIAQQISTGYTPAAIIFAQQSGQVIQSIQLMQGEGNAFVRFLGSGWGVAISAAAIILAPFIARLFDTRTELQKAIQDLEENARKADIDRAAHEAFGATLAGVTEALRANRQTLDQLSHAHDSAATQALRAALLGRARLTSIQSETAALIRQTRAEIELNDARNRVAGNDPRITGPLNAESDAARARLSQLEAELSTIPGQMAEAQRQIDEAISQRVVELGSRSPEERIHDRYSGANGLIEQARRRAAAEHLTTVELNRQVAALRDQERQEVEAHQRAERDRRRDPRRRFNQEATDNAGEGLISTARHYMGYSENSGDQRAALMAFFRQAGINIDPRVTAWCAAFVQAVLHANGLPVQRGPDGNIALGARQLLNYGTATRNPQPGDLVVMSRGGANSGLGHAGLFMGYDARGNVQMLSGNSGRGSAQVSIGSYSRDRVLGFRHIDAAQAQRTAQQQAEQDARDRADFERDMQQAGEHLLQARRAQAETVEQQLAFELDQIETDRQQAMAAMEEKVRQGHRTEAEAQLYSIQQDMVAQARARAARERAADDLAQQRLRNEQETLQQETELERMVGQLAETRQQQLASALRVAALEHEKELGEIELARLQAQEIQDAQARADALRRVDARERFINDSYDLQNQIISRQNEGPWARRMRELRAASADIGTQLEELDVRALDALDQSLRNSIKSALGLHGALGDIIADLAMIFVRQQAMSLLGGGKGGGGLFSFLGGLLGIAGGSGGFGPAGSLAGAIPGPFGIPIGKRAAGGPVSAGTPYLVGERGPEIVVPKVPGLVIPNHAIGAMGRGSIHVAVSLDNNMLQARIVRTSAGVTASLAPGIASSGADMALNRASRRAARALPTGV